MALSISILALLQGIASGEPTRIIEQAVQICLSCIGIG
ncbi:MAG: CD1871A family CXXC motif-containing protein [Thermodesulfobacteriota bacterium]